MKHVANDFRSGLKVERPAGFFGRLRGLIGRGELEANCAFLIERCRSVHGFGIAAPIDVAFIDADAMVLRIVTLRPCTFAWCRRARHTVELRSGECVRLGIVVGEKI